MKLDFLFFLNSVLFGVGLAMDAFSISLVNGLLEPEMSKKRMCGIASVYCIYQILMPLLGWVCVHTIATVFSSFQKWIPWIALILLGYIGGKMLLEGIQNKEEHTAMTKITFGVLMIQGIATSIDALSVGFTIADYDFLSALIESLIIGIVTFAICIAGLLLGRKFGTKFSNKANILGGSILIAIGIEILLKGIL